jgi:hypothetical protein
MSYIIAALIILGYLLMFRAWSMHPRGAEYGFPGCVTLGLFFWLIAGWLACIEYL